MYVWDTISNLRVACPVDQAASTIQQTKVPKHTPSEIAIFVNDHVRNGHIIETSQALSEIARCYPRYVENLFWSPTFKSDARARLMLHADTRLARVYFGEKRLDQTSDLFNTLEHFYPNDPTGTIGALLLFDESSEALTKLYAECRGFVYTDPTRSQDLCGYVEKLIDVHSELHRRWDEIEIFINPNECDGEGAVSEFAGIGLLTKNPLMIEPFAYCMVGLDQTSADLGTKQYFIYDNLVARDMISPSNTSRTKVEYTPTVSEMEAFVNDLVKTVNGKLSEGGLSENQLGRYEPMGSEKIDVDPFGFFENLSFEITKELQDVCDETNMTVPEVLYDLVERSFNHQDTLRQACLLSRHEYPQLIQLKPPFKCYEGRMSVKNVANRNTIMREISRYTLQQDEDGQYSPTKHVYYTFDAAESEIRFYFCYEISSE